MVPQETVLLGGEETAAMTGSVSVIGLHMESDSVFAHVRWQF